MAFENAPDRRSSTHRSAFADVERNCDRAGHLRTIAVSGAAFSASLPGAMRIASIGHRGGLAVCPARMRCPACRTGAAICASVLLHDGENPIAGLYSGLMEGIDDR